MERKRQKADPIVINVNDTGPQSVSALKEHIAALERELEDLKESEKALKEGQEYFQDIFETVKEGLALTTLRGKVLAVNRNLEQIVGVPGKFLLGRNIMRIASDMLSGENLKFVLPLLKDLLYGKEIKPFQLFFNDRILEISASINRNTKRLTGTIRDITQNRKTEEALTKSELRLRRAELASKSGNWELHLDNKIMIGSEGALKLYGLDEPLIDYSIAKEIPLPEYREKMDIALKQLIEDNKPYDIEFRIINASTREIIDIHSICDYDRKNRVLFGSIQDITERKKAEEEIRKKNLSLALLLEIAKNILETLDRKKILKAIVESSIRLIGMDTAAIYSIKGDDLFLEATTPALPDDFPDEFRKARIENHPHILKVVQTKAHCILYNAKEASLTPEERVIVDQRGLGSILYIPLVTNKNTVGVLILGSVGRVLEFEEHQIDLCKTLSSLVSLSLENSDLFESLTIAKNKAEESDRLKTAFLHNISHEIRTPLNAIIGFSGFLDQPDLKPDERKEYIDIIFQSNNQLLSIINDILNISQIEANLVIVRESAANLNNILKNLHRQFLDDERRAGIEFRLNISLSGSDNIILTDESKLIQVLSNLLSNAFKFTHKGFVELGFARDGEYAEFYVQDTGIGIPESEHRKIFERFYQVDKTVSRLYSGTGLGLSISDAYVRLLGGEFSVASSPDEGSRFSFRIPWRRPVSETSALIQSTPVISTGSTIKTILIAEDEESNFALVYAMLKPHGYKMMRAKNGVAAVDICRSNPEIDLILMDIKMPLMDGFDATREILKFRPHLPIIAQTAYAHPSDRAKAIETGCAEYLAKPFDRKQLLEVVRKYLE
ncbi:MAG: ATP-binding protein [Bacteroidia bacterium]|nr:ATP-binding protein [Bacteroidia bacterium]